MAYSSGGTILDDHYNGFANDLNDLWGTGSGNEGYGQGSALSTVSAGASITATQWETLLSRLETIATHQGTSGVSFSTISTGDTITALADISSDITSVTTNRGNAASQGTAISSTSSRTGSWNGCLTYTATFTFDSANAARYFFNCGGVIKVDFSNGGGGSKNKDTAWGNLIAAAGPVYITAAGSSGPASTVTIAGTSYYGTDHKGSGSPTTEATTKGWFDLTSSYQTVFKQLDTTYDYTSNFVQIEAKKTSTVVTLLIKLQDTQVGSEHNPTLANPQDRDEVVDLNISAVCSLIPGATSISTSWDTPTVSTSNTATSGTGYTC